jgi:putative hydrolase of the HAD superfamily
MDQNNKITTLFLDIGGVLLTNGWDHNIRRQAAEKYSLDFEEMNERHHLTFDTYEEGKLRLDKYLDRVVFYQPRQFSREEFKDYMYAQSRPIPEMIELICSLKEQYGLRLGAISNEGRELTIYRVGEFKLGEFIDFFVSSCFVHFRKPDEDMFCMALDISQVQPENVAYIDDRAMFVEVAQSLGIHGILHTSYEKTRGELEKLGLSLRKV